MDLFKAKQIEVKRSLHEFKMFLNELCGYTEARIKLRGVIAEIIGVFDNIQTLSWTKECI